MADLFLKLLNLSLSASFLVLMVILLRLAFRKAPRWVYPVLWGIVALRLICPISIESVLSLLPSAQPIPADIAMAPRPVIDSGIPVVNQVVNPVIAETFAPAPLASANPLQIWLEVGGWVWLVGMAGMLLYTLATYLHLRRRVSTAVPAGRGAYQCETVGSPFVLGLFRPRIYLPMNLDPGERQYIEAHERAHIHRRDHLWKPLGFVLLAFHWFNPLMWLAYILLCRDIELACDEAVIRQLGREGRADYSQALLRCSVSRRSIAACPLAFGEVGVKQRVKSVLCYKKPGFWVVTAAVALCITFAVCFLTNPKKMVVRKGVYEPGEMIYCISPTPVVEHWFPMPFSWIKSEPLDPYLCRLTADDSLEFKPQSAEEALWLPGVQMEHCDFSNENFAEITENTKNWEGASIGPIADAMVAQEDTRHIYLFRTKDGTDYLGIAVKPYDWAKEFLAYLTKLNLVEEYPDEEIPEPTGMAAEWGLTMDIDDASPEGANVYFWQDGSPLTGTLWCSDDYILQKQDGKKWVDLPKREEPEFTGEDIPVRTDDTYFLDWKKPYGSLPSGTYRVGKPVRLRNEGIGEMEKTLWAAFTVKGTDSGLKMLTAADLVAIKERGDALSWDTFEDFACVESESNSFPGLPIHFHRAYRVSDHLSFSVNGRGLEYLPNNMVLYCRDCPTQPNIMYNFDQNADSIRLFLAAHDRPVPEGETNHLSLHFEVQNATPTGAEVILERRDGGSLDKDPYTVYSLSRLEPDGRWTSVEDLSEDAHWTWLENLDNGRETTVEVGRSQLNWENRYGALPGGRYRLFARVDAHDGSFGGVDLRAEFTIPEQIEAEESDNWGVSIAASQVTPEHLLLNYYRAVPGKSLYSMPGFTLEKQTDQGWTSLPVGTWEVYVGDAIDFGWYSQEGNGMLMSWDRLGPLHDGHYRLGLEIADDRDLDKAKVLTVYAEFTLDTSDWVDGRVPLNQIPANYHPEDGEMDGCLVLTAGIPRSSAQQVFAPFREAVDTGRAASVRFVTSYLSEETPPYTVYVHDLVFDGKTFTLTWLEEGREQVKTYQYLKRFVQPMPENAVGSYIPEWFVLTNDENLNMTAYDPESRNLQQGVDPEHEVVFCQQTFVPQRPELPGDITKAELVFENQVCLNVGDPERIEKLCYLFTSAELLDYEPKTHSVGTGLNLILTTAGGEKITIELDVDGDIARMNGEFIWYGAPDEPDYIEKLWYYLGIQAWPDAVYEKYPDSFRGNP